MKPKQKGVRERRSACMPCRHRKGVLYVRRPRARGAYELLSTSWKARKEQNGMDQIEIKHTYATKHKKRGVSGCWLRLQHLDISRHSLPTRERPKQQYVEKSGDLASYRHVPATAAQVGLAISAPAVCPRIAYSSIGQKLHGRQNTCEEGWRHESRKEACRSNFIRGTLVDVEGANASLHEYVP